MAASTCRSPVRATLKRSDARLGLPAVACEGMTSVRDLGSGVNVDTNGAEMAAEHDQSSSSHAWTDASQLESLEHGTLAPDPKFDNDILRPYYSDRRNLVLDSACPYIAPHIVITPPADDWDDYFTSWQNRVDTQWMGCLTIPPVDVTMKARHPLPLSRIPTPQKWRSGLRRRVKSKLVQAQTFYDAANAESSFSSDIDALPPMNLPGTLVIESSNPSVAPHIIITIAPPDDPWVAYNNATNNPQDASFGHQLVVPSPSIEVFNAPTQGWMYSMQGLASCSSLFDSDFDSVDLPETPVDSRPGSPPPETPVRDEDARDLDIFLMRHGDDVESEFCEYIPAADLPVIAKDSSPLYHISGPRDPIYAIEEDDEDLPPLDEWYQRWM